MRSGLISSNRRRGGGSSLPVVALWNFEGGAGAYLVDKSPNAFTLTQNGSFSRKIGGGLGGSDAAGRTGTQTASRGTLAHNSAFIFSGPFTVEGYIDRGTSTALGGVAAKWQNVANGRSWALRCSGSSLFPVAELSLDGATAALTLTSPTALTGTSLQHLCLERNNSDLVRLYLDGNIVASGTLAGALFDNNTIPLEVGGYNAGGAAVGYTLDEVRITAAAVYDGAFTPPGAHPIP